MKLLLHACCGPCSLEPVKFFSEAGYEVSIAYMNSNIHPLSEYLRRRNTLATWAAEENLPVIEGIYSPKDWERAIEKVFKKQRMQTAKKLEVTEKADEIQEERRERCRACYRLRFAEACAYAVENAFDAVSTTLSVSPYQFIDIIKEELEAAGKHYGIEVLFNDFRPQYSEATHRSRELGMYRQNYCGCRFSEAEAALERQMRRQRRKSQKRQEKDKKPAATEKSESEHIDSPLSFIQEAVGRLTNTQTAP